MTHANDLALVIRDLLRNDPTVYLATLAQGEPRADVVGYPNRDGAWKVFVMMRDGRYFNVEVTAEFDVGAGAENVDGDEPPWAQRAVRPIGAGQ